MSADHDAGTRLTPANLFFLWFGAAVSVAEILTGGYLADLGLTRGLWAIFLGHVVGTVLLALGGIIGGRERLPSIRSTRISFGRQGSYLISVVNILQLLGWTAVMIVEGGRAINTVTTALWGMDHPAVAAVAIGAFIGLWVFIGVRGFKWLNTVAVALLLGLTVVLSWTLLNRPMPAEAASAVGAFGVGFELSIIMPLSWFPLIADYTSLAEPRKGSWLAPFVGYFIGSCWMYAIGMLAALLTGSADPTGMMIGAGLGLVALLIVGLSTITTTFLDVWSAAESSLNILPNLSRRWTAVGFAVAGTALALVFPIENYIDFLYILGSVFSPLISILLCDYFLMKWDSRHKAADPVAMVSLVAGIAFYYAVKNAAIVVGPTLTTIGVTLVLHVLLRTLQRLAAGMPMAEGLRRFIS